MRIVIGLTFLFHILFAQGFLHVEDGQIVEGDGESILLRGFGLGGWLVPEGYMLHNKAWIEGFESPTEIEEHVESLIGAELAESFWALYRESYVAQVDIDQIAEWGFNHIRIPFHYKQFYNESGSETPIGYDIIDELITWCEPYNMYIILDMHCAPGGQNGGPISDSDGTARLWLEEENKELTIQIWREIAEYYSDNTLIGGYDLINEPVLPSGVSLEEFRQLYIDITDAIREVDSNHIVYIEGNWYGTDFSGLTPPWDDNMSYSFHKYWGETSLSTIQSYISMSGQHNIPLWMGESGENSNQWYYEVFSLLEENNIGWNFWTHKKVEKITSPFSAIVTPQYQTLINYWSGSGSQPSSVYAEAALISLANSLKLENCISLPGVIASLTDPEYGEISKPYSEHSIPGTIPAAEYDIGAWGLSYTDSDYLNDGDGNYNEGWSFRNDGVDIEANGSEGLPYTVGWTDAGEWLGYTIQNVTPGTYDLKIKVAAPSSGGLFFVQLNGTNLSVIDVPSTGGWYNWQSVLVPDVDVSNGEQFLKIQIVQAGFNIERIKFELLASVEYFSEWNLVGSPLEIEDTNYQSLFPESTAGTLYSYNGEQYIQEEDFQMGNGYWLHFENEGTTQLSGTTVNQLTLQLNTGWNLISGISSEVDLSEIFDPENIIVPGTCYGFNQTYINAYQLTPGHGYWIYASTAGSITISNSSVYRSDTFIQKDLDKANKLSFNGGNLYFGITIPEGEMLSYQFPPKPPVGAFDVRFKDGLRAVKDYGVIEVMPVTEYLTIAYDIILNTGGHMNWVLSSKSDDFILEGTGEFTVPSAESFTLNLKAVVPASFTLHQNFPNPFNPITTIRYDLPSDAFVTLSIYDMLGKEITQLVNTNQQAGFKSIQWDAVDSMDRSVSAGIYLYQIQTGELIKTKKMVLLR